MIKPKQVSKAATENKIKVKYCPRKSSKIIDANIILIFTPSNISSKANKIKIRLGFKMRINKAKIKKITDNRRIMFRLTSYSLQVLNFLYKARKR